MAKQHMIPRHGRQPELFATVISLLLAIFVPSSSRADETQIGNHWMHCVSEEQRQPLAVGDWVKGGLAN